MKSVSGEAYLYFWLAVEVCDDVSTDSTVRGLVICVIRKSKGSNGCKPSSSTNPIAKWQNIKSPFGKCDCLAEGEICL